MEKCALIDLHAKCAPIDLPAKMCSWQRNFRV